MNQEVTPAMLSKRFDRRPKVVKPGDRHFLNDGLVQWFVERVAVRDVHRKVAVVVGLRSKQGLRLPGIKRGIGAFTDRDRACLEFAPEKGGNAASRSFIETAELESVLAAAKAIGMQPIIISKSEHPDALVRFDDLLKAADDMMVARGDLGGEVPIEEMAILQKQLIAKADLPGNPVNTATQTLEFPRVRDTMPRSAGQPQ